MKRILFVCVHNAGRSQMAEAFFNQLAGQRGLNATAESAGTAPGERVSPLVIDAMAEAGLGLDGQRPRRLTAALATVADRMITMGCGVEADLCPAGTYFSEDWQLPDPHGQPLPVVREMRNAVRRRVAVLVDELEAVAEAVRAEA